MDKPDPNHVIQEDAYFYCILSRMRKDETLSDELMRIGDTLGVKRPKHLALPDDKHSAFEESLKECSHSMQLVLEGKAPRHDGGDQVS